MNKRRNCAWPVKRITQLFMAGERYALFSASRDARRSREPLAAQQFTIARHQCRALISSI